MQGQNAGEKRAIAPSSDPAAGDSIGRRAPPSLAPIRTAGGTAGEQGGSDGLPVRTTFSRRGQRVPGLQSMGGVTGDDIVSPGPVRGPMTPAVHHQPQDGIGRSGIANDGSTHAGRAMEPMPSHPPRNTDTGVQLRPLRKYQAPPGEKPFQFRVGRPLPSLPPRSGSGPDGEAPEGMGVQLEHPGQQQQQQQQSLQSQGQSQAQSQSQSHNAGPQNVNANLGTGQHPNAIPDSELDGDDFVPATKHVVSMGELENRGPSAMQENVFYVENARTGDFTKMARSELGAAAKVAAGPSRDDDENVRATTFKAFMDGLAKVVATFFLLSQGALGGFSLLQLMFTVRYPPNVEFLRYYSPLAADAQRVYFVLTTLSLLAAIDKYAKDKMSGWNGTELRQQIVDVLIIACYFVAFLFSLLNANTDDLLTYSEARVPGWYDTRGIPSSFSSTLARWHAFNIIRIIGSIGGWLLVSSETRSYGINDANYDLLLRQRQSQAAALE